MYLNEVKQQELWKNRKVEERKRIPFIYLIFSVSSSFLLKNLTNSTRQQQCRSPNYYTFLIQIRLSPHFPLPLLEKKVYFLLRADDESKLSNDAASMRCILTCHLCSTTYCITQYKTRMKNPAQENAFVLHASSAISANLDFSPSVQIIQFYFSVGLDLTGQIRNLEYQYCRYVCTVVLYCNQANLTSGFSFAFILRGRMKSPPHSHFEQVYVEFEFSNNSRNNNKNNKNSNSNRNSSRTTSTI